MLVLYCMYSHHAHKKCTITMYIHTPATLLCSAMDCDQRKQQAKFMYSHPATPKPKLMYNCIVHAPLPCNAPFWSKAKKQTSRVMLLRFRDVDNTRLHVLLLGRSSAHKNRNHPRHAQHTSHAALQENKRTKPHRSFLHKPGYVSKAQCVQP